MRKVQEYTIRAIVLLAFWIKPNSCSRWANLSQRILAKQISRKPLIVHIHATEFDRAVVLETKEFIN